MRRLYNFFVLFVLCLFASCAKTDDMNQSLHEDSHKAAFATKAISEAESILSVLCPLTRDSEAREVKNVEVVFATHSGALDTLMYIVNFKDNRGYVLVAAESHRGGVLAFIEQGNLSADEFMSEEYDASDGPTIPKPLIIDHIGDLDLEDPTDPPHEKSPFYGPWSSDNSVGPLLTTNWSQGWPYNTECPVIDGLNSLAGCWAIAIGQVFAYNRMTYGLGADELAGYDLDWDTILSEMQLNEKNSHLAIATLIRAIGKSVDMDYGLAASSANIDDAESCFHAMGYSSADIRKYDAGYAEKMIVERRKPFCMRGHSDGSGYSFGEPGGHAWVIDGYGDFQRNQYRDAGSDEIVGVDKKTLVHCNFGWGGACNGFYVSGIFDLYDGSEIPDEGHERDNFGANYWSGNKLIYYN